MAPSNYPASQRWSVFYMLLLSLSIVTCLVDRRQPVQERWLECLHGGAAGSNLQVLPSDKKDARLGAQPPGRDEVLEIPELFGTDIFSEVERALETMQSRFFQLWLGDWPTANDWTGAVMSSFVSTTLTSISKSISCSVTPSSIRAGKNVYMESTINMYFSQISSYYFGEDAFSIRAQAYDDMLWVVLGWLDAIKLINIHSRLQHESYSVTSTTRNISWHGKQFEPAFAHRAHVFYDIVSRAWDPTLCGGGLTWNPRLMPYKNTITNTLFISASVGMYLHHPGDNNSAPFMISTNRRGAHTPIAETGNYGLPSTMPHDLAFLRAAVKAYDWLQQVNLTNSAGLYVDGYHISRWSRRFRSGPAQCDQRNEMVYSYNQGVVLSGLRDLWESTGDLRYLRDGHELVRNVISETGWKAEENGKVRTGQVMAGLLGRDGILQEACDPFGTCNQDGQTFKGIFFQHLTAFCEPLPVDLPLISGITFIALPDTAILHAGNCRAYKRWVAHNARAALATRDESGLFGTWWGANADRAGKYPQSFVRTELPEGAFDVRNRPEILLEERWAANRERDTDDGDGDGDTTIISALAEEGDNFIPLREVLDIVLPNAAQEGPTIPTKRDLNDRGRGRTVETQGGGLSVLRALWEMDRWYS